MSSPTRRRLKKTETTVGARRNFHTICIEKPPASPDQRTNGMPTKLRKAAADKIEEHDIWRCNVAEQLYAHGKADKDGVAHGSHHHKNAELTVRQPHQAARQQAHHNAARDDEQRDEQQTRRGEHVRAREIVLHPVDQHDGNADGHQIAADEGLDLHGHPALDRAEVAGRRQQQDNGDGCNGVKKGFHRSVPQKIYSRKQYSSLPPKNKASTEKKLKTEDKWAMIKKISMHEEERR